MCAALNNNQGHDRLAAALHIHRELPLRQLLHTVLAEARHHSSDGRFEDDVCLVGMEVAARWSPA